MTPYGLPTPLHPPEDLDLAFAEVDPSGSILSISLLGTQYWGWQTGNQVPKDVLEALGTVSDSTTRALLRVQQDDLSLLGLALEPGEGWLLIGVASEKPPSDRTSIFKSLIEKAPTLVLRMRADGTVLYADTEAWSATGYASDEIIDRPFLLEVIHPEDRWRLTESLRRAVEEQRITTATVRFLAPRQDLRLAKIYLLPAAPQAIAAAEALVFDVTEQTRSEAFLLQSEAFYRTFLEQSPMGILHLDARGTVTFENHAFRQIVGEAVDEVWIGRSIDDIPGLEERLKPLISAMLTNGTALQGEVTTYRRAGSHLPAHLVMHGSPIRQPSGEIVGGVMMVEDVTEQRQREEELLLRDRYEKAEIALREAVLADLNETVFLHEAAEILGKTVRADRIHLLTHVGDDGNCVTRAVWVRREEDEPFSLFVRSGDYPALRSAVVNGHSLYLRAGGVSENAKGLLELTEAEEVIWVPFYDTGRLGGFVLFERMTLLTDASVGFWQHTEQRLMERLVRLFETLWSWIQVGQRYRLTVATIDDCLFTFSFARSDLRRYLFITPQIQKLTGFGADEVLARGESMWSWVDTLVHPDDRGQVRKHDQALRNGRESRLTYRVLHRNGSMRWLCEDATPHRDTSGRVTVSGILMDVTEQKDVEDILLSAREQVKSASRLKSTFVTTMSHELRTPLGSVNGFVELLALELAEWEERTSHTLPSQVHEFVEAVRQNAKRLLGLTDNLFVLSNMEIGALRLERATVPLHPMIQSATRKVAVQLAEKGITLHVEVAPDDITVLGDAQRIEQILDNLLSNAVKFTDKGCVAVRTRQVQDEAQIEVVDTGIGIDRDYMDSIFSPFVQEDNRLNRRYEGTGLGLTLVKRLLDLMGGRIEAESEKGKGSTFRVFLPLAE